MELYYCTSSNGNNYIVWSWRKLNSNILSHDSWCWRSHRESKYGLMADSGMPEKTAPSCQILCHRYSRGSQPFQICRHHRVVGSIKNLAALRIKSNFIIGSVVLSGGVRGYWSTGLSSSFQYIGSLGLWRTGFPFHIHCIGRPHLQRTGYLTPFNYIIDLSSGHCLVLSLGEGWKLLQSTFGGGH